MTTKVRNLAGAPLRERVSAEEWDQRVNLAACYRLAAHFRMTDLIMYYLERACQTQVAAMAGGAKPRIPPPAVAEKTAAQFRALPYKPKRPESLVLLCAALFATGMPASAQHYPSRPVRMIVGFPPGGGTDVVARILQPKLSEYLGQSVVIDNRPGATGTVAAGLVARSPADGYTIMKGTGQSIPDLLAGQHQVTFDTMPAASPYVRSGRMRPLAVTSVKRVAEFASVPTVEESGVPGYQITTWYGVFAPAGTPAAIVNRLHGEFAKAMQAPGTRERLVELGFDGTVTRTPEEFAALVRADIVRYAKLVKDAGLQID